jgi:hypothetical protein
MPAVSGNGSPVQYQMYQAYSFRLFSRANMFFREKSIFMVGTFSSEGPSDRIERSNEMHVARDTTHARSDVPRFRNYMPRSGVAISCEVNELSVRATDVKSG